MSIEKVCEVVKKTCRKHKSLLNVKKYANSRDFFDRNSLKENTRSSIDNKTISINSFNIQINKFLLFPSLSLDLDIFSKMKVVFCLFACLSIALALPQREGAAFTNDAIKQAQSSHLIPAGAQIQNVSRT